MGFDEGFLGERMPLPAAPGPAITLDYEHFTVEQSVERRFAFYAAVNIDGSALVEVERSDDWRLDERAGDAQFGPELYARNDLDRGHLVRRRDPVWGSPEVAARANAETFRYPNAAPQASGFNQSKELWLGLEDHVLAYAETTDQRMSVFTAPVLAEADPPYRGIRIPVRFWKVAAWQGPAGLAAAGFLLDQTELVDTPEGLLAAPPLGAFRTFQVPVSDIAGITAIDFGPLPDADVLPRRTAKPAAWRPLATPADIIV